MQTLMSILALALIGLLAIGAAYALYVVACWLSRAFYNGL